MLGRCQLLSVALLLVAVSVVQCKDTHSYQTSCVTLNGTISFNVTYFKSSGAMGYFSMSINDNPIVDGSCGSDSATLGIKYNDRQWFNLTLTKNAESTKKVAAIDPLHWGVTKLSLDYTVNQGDQATQGDRHAEVEGSYFVTPLNKSYSCSAEQIRINTTTVNSTSEFVMLNEEGLQLSFADNTSDTVYDYHYCKADQKIKDIVPIAVGCALAALVIIVLIAYLIGRRRTVAMGGYERV